jgi:O-antigen/teichoic acid export membrane protein
MEDPRFRETLAGKTSWSAAASLASGVGAAGMSVLLARLLGPTGAGEASYALWAATTMAQLATLGLPQAATRFLAAEENADARRRLASWLIRRGALCAFPAGLLGAALAGSAAGHGTALAGGAGVAAAATALAVLAQGVLAGLQDFRRLARLAALSAVVPLGAVALLAQAAGPGGALAGFALAQVVLGSALGFLGGGRPEAGAMRRRVRIYAFDAWLAAGVSLFTWSRFELFFLERTAGAAAVAMFSIAVTIAQLAVLPVTLLGGALLPHLAELSAARETGLRDEAYAAATRLGAFVAFPLCFGLAAPAPALVPLVFGSDFQEGAPPAAVVVAAASLGAAATAGSALLYALERSRFIAGAGLGIAAISTAVYATVIPRAGLMGAALSRAGVQALAVAAGTVYIGVRIGVRVPLGSVARGACAALLAAMPGAAVVHAGGARWGVVFAALAASGIAYVPLARLLRVLEPGDVAYIDASLSVWPAPVRVAARALLGASSRPLG